MDCAQVVGDSSPAAMGFPPTHEHGGSVCATAGSLGGREDGSLSPDLRAGNSFLSMFNRQEEADISTLPRSINVKV